MAVENPPPLTPLATAAPQRGNRATFSPLVDAFVTWLIASVAQFVALAQNVWHNANEAYVSALVAAASQGAASASASAAGTAAGEAFDRASAAASSASAAAVSATEAADSAGAAEANANAVTQMGASVLAHAALAGLPSIAPGDAGKFLGVNATGSGLALLYAEILVLEYSARAELRQIEAVPTQVLVKGLGLFVWSAGSTEPDDDATCFRSATGAWELKLIDPDYASSLWGAEIDRLALGTDRMARATFNMTLTSLASNTSAAFVVPVPGVVPGDGIVVVPGNAFGITSADQGCLTHSAYVSEPGAVTVTIRNADGSARNMAASTWSVLVIKQ